MRRLPDQTKRGQARRLIKLVDDQCNLKISTVLLSFIPCIDTIFLISYFFNVFLEPIMTSSAILLSVPLLVVGCMAAGVRVEEAQLSQFHSGQTNYSQVIAALGQPTGSAVSSTGARTVTYTSFHYQTRPESFIPYVGPFVGGADTSNSTVVFTFGPDGLLQGYDSSSGAIGTSTGILTGAATQQRTAQPR